MNALSTAVYLSALYVASLIGSLIHVSKTLYNFSLATTGVIAGSNSKFYTFSSTFMDLRFILIGGALNTGT